jgi:hypothetical protein
LICPIKLLALSGRPAARDFADVYVLADCRGREVLLGRAAQVDAGLDTRILAGMLAILEPTALCRSRVG